MPQEIHNAYAAHQRGDETVRETETHALLNCAAQLESSLREGAARDDVIEAIRHNQQLWTLFQSCLCEAENPLPRELKRLLLNISIYVDKVSMQAMTDENPRLLLSLISINRTIAAGLAKSPAMEKPAPVGARPSAYGAAKPDQGRHEPISTVA